MRVNALQADLGDVVNCRAQSDGLHVAGVKLSISTVLIMLPPPRNGGIDSSSASRP